MAVNLQKGQKISLEKEAGSKLNSVVMGLGWDAAKKKGFLGGLFGGGVLLLQLGVFAVDFLDGGLGGGLFAFEALALALP